MPAAAAAAARQQPPRARGRLHRLGRVELRRSRNLEQWHPQSVEQELVLAFTAPAGILLKAELFDVDAAAVVVGHHDRPARGLRRHAAGIATVRGLLIDQRQLAAGAIQ